MKRICPHCGKDGMIVGSLTGGEDFVLRVESRLLAAKEELSLVRKALQSAEEELDAKQQVLRGYEEEVSVLLTKRRAALSKHGETLVALSAARKELGKLKREYFERYVKPHLPAEVLAEYLRLKPKPGEGGKVSGAE